jgi:hypothetical protein
MEEMGTGDIIIGLLAALGVVILVLVFIFVVKTVFYSKEEN